MPKAHPLKIWITRTSPGAQATAQRVSALGYTPIIAPLLKSETQNVSPATGQDIAFTSPNGPRFYAGPITVTAWCVGEATATSARSRGFSSIITADPVLGGDVAGLAAQMVSELTRPVLHWAGAHIRGELVTALREAGHDATRIIAYRAEAVTHCMLKDTVDIVLFHSPRAAEIYAKLTPDIARTSVSISPATDEKLATLTLLTRYIADTPTEDAVMTALARAANALDKP